MKIIPAVDMKGGKAVRLKQGKADQQTVYDDDPVHAAKRWADLGASRIHIVDLDGAFEGIPRNREITLAILRAFPADSGIEIQIGGGLRRAEDVALYIENGASRCVVGTKALEDPALLSDLATRFPGRINLGLDAHNGKVATKGWVEVSSTMATELIAKLSALKLGEVIYTDIETDGMLQGPNLKRLEEIKRVSPFPLIASGGITTLDHLRACKDLGCYGAIVGKALYDGKLELIDAIRAVQ